LVGLKRRGFSREQLEDIRKAYRIIFHSGLSARAALARLKKELPVSREAAIMGAFIGSSQRGICR
jgi:UDP-N-acetylglucosamine acyltransferase